MRRGLAVAIALILLLTGTDLMAGGTGYFYQPQDTLIKAKGTFHELMVNKEAEQLSSIRLYADTISMISAWEPYKIPPLKELNIVAVGDVMPGTDYPSEEYLPSGCSELFDPVRELISSADIAIANLEGVFSSSGGEPKNCNDPKACYVFRMPDEYASCIKDAGFDLLGMANNHINDFGYTGRMNTVKVLEKEGFGFAGFPEYPYYIHEVNGLKVGFCAFAPHTGTLSLTDYEAAAELVSMLDSICDLVVVTFHGGAEGKNHQHVTREDEFFYGYNRGNVHYFAHKVVDAGADLVIGHGPHVVRAVEFYKDKLIAYSLGNFCTYRRFNLSGPNANAPLLQVWMDEDGNFVRGRIHSFIQLGEGGPVPDPLNASSRAIEALNLTDFPEQLMTIDEEGWIFPTGFSEHSAENFSE